MMAETTVQPPARPDASPLLEVEGLRKEFDLGGGLVSRLRGQRRVVRAVELVSFPVYAGRTLGLVGESGCGKTTVGKTIMRLYDPTAGSIRFRGQDIARLSGHALQSYRRQVQMVFQDPQSSLNRRKTVEQILSVPLAVHHLARGRERAERIEQVLEQVGLDARFRRRYPHEFSGGQQQRIGIARALISAPSFIIADEPVSALDVSTQAQIINLLTDLQAGFDLAYLFITHDLSVVKHISQDIAVMYLGEIVETGPTRFVFTAPAHPYTQALLSAVPRIESRQRGRAHQRIILTGEVPSLVKPPTGCKFHTRCPAYLGDICKNVSPEPRDLGGGHIVRCHLFDEAGKPIATTARA